MARKRSDSSDKGPVAWGDETQEDVVSPFARPVEPAKRKGKKSRPSSTRSPEAKRSRRSRSRPAPTPMVVPDVPFSPSDIVSSADVVQTVVLDSKQHDELMALRAQQDAALKERFEKNVTVMFTDLVGSTAYYEKYGDLKGREKVLTHNALLFPLIQNAGGVIIKTIGDAIMACFDSVNDALAVAAAMQHNLAEHNQDIGSIDDEIHIRIALNYGIAITQDGDIHGDVVNVAARIEHEAPADEIWVADTVQQESSGWPLESVGAVSFKGKAGKTALFRLAWQEVARPEQGRGLESLPAQYQLGEMLGHGDIGHTFRGLDTKTKRPICIKGLHHFLAREPKAREAFAEAAARMSRLTHEGIVRVLDWSRDDAQEPYLVTAFVPSLSLEQLVQRHGCPPAAHAALIVYRVAQILAYAHKQGVLHGDLKPECVLVTEEGQLRLVNFGLANVAASQVERTGSTIGNPAFMAPEQVVGAACDARTDVYSLGALVYFLLCGRSPYESAGVQVTREVTSGGFTPIKRLNPDAPDALADVVGKALSIIPEGRPADLHRFAAELAKHFKPAGLDLQRDLTSFLTDTWPAQVPMSELSTTEIVEPDRTEAIAALGTGSAGASGPVTLTRHATRGAPEETPRRGINLPLAMVGAIVIAAVFFALGWRLGEGRAREYLGNAKARALQPVDEVDQAEDPFSAAEGASDAEGPQVGARGSVADPAEDPAEDPLENPAEAPFDDPAADSAVEP